MVVRWSTSLRLVKQNSPNAVTKDKAAGIAADFMTTFYHVQIGALETQEFRFGSYEHRPACSLD
jgi:hypothetical protein